MIDVIVVSFALCVYLALALILLTTIEWRNAPLMGFLVLSTGMVLLGGRSLLGRLEYPLGLQDDLLWMYRLYVIVGGAMVLWGLIQGLRHNMPPPRVSATRVVVGFGVLLVSGGIVRLTLTLLG